MIDDTNPLDRRGLLRTGAIGGTGALLTAGTGGAYAAATPPPVDSTAYPDFSPIKLGR